MNYQNIFIDHFRKYPKMLPSDFFKLIYQNSHGPHHLDKNKIKDNFIKEINSLTKIPKDQYEYIGNNYIRIYLNPLWDNNEKEQILNAFIKSNLDYNPDPLLLYKELEILNDLIVSKKINLNIQVFQKEMNEYIINGPKAISHSTIYKENYDPHYVVINSLYFKNISAIMEKNYERQEKASSF